MSFLLLAGALARCLSLLHPFRHLRFHRIEIETRASLHRWKIKECLKLLAHHLLDEHKAPELEFEPIEVLLCSLFCSVVRPALALERIEPEVDQVRHVNMGLFTQPPTGLVNEAILVVVNPHCADSAFAKVEDLVTLGGRF